MICFYFLVMIEILYLLGCLIVSSISAGSKLGACFLPTELPIVCLVSVKVLKINTECDYPLIFFSYRFITVNFYSNSVVLNRCLPPFSQSQFSFIPLFFYTSLPSGIPTLTSSFSIQPPHYHGAVFPKLRSEQVLLFPLYSLV